MEKIYPISVNDWQKVVCKATDATFFHTPTWSKIFSEYSQGQWEVDSRGCKLSDGTVVVLPALKRAATQSQPAIIYSMKPGVYGGLIAQRTLNAEEFGSVCDLLINSLPCDLQIVSNPLNDYQYSKENFLKQMSTRMLNLQDDFNDIWRGFTKGHRSSSKKAANSGVNVRIADCLNDYKRYYEIYQDSVNRWAEKASSSYDWRLFEIISQKNSPNIKLWLAEMGDLLISGALVFYWNHHVVWWHGANLSSHMTFCGANLLQVEIIKDAIDNGYHYYDFNPSGGHQGVENFKRSFGAYKKEIAVYRKPALTTCNSVFLEEK